MCTITTNISTFFHFLPFIMPAHCPPLLSSLLSSSLVFPHPLPPPSNTYTNTVQEEDVVRLLHSLSCAKYQILAKEPAGKTINKNDRFK